MGKKGAGPVPTICACGCGQMVLVPVRKAFVDNVHRVRELRRRKREEAGRTPAGKPTHTQRK